MFRFPPYRSLPLTTTRVAPIPLLPIYRPTDYRWSVSADNRYLQSHSHGFFHRRTYFPRPLSDGSRPCSCLSSIFTSKSIVSRPVHSFITSLWSVGIVAAAVFDGFASFFPQIMSKIWKYVVVDSTNSKFAECKHLIGNTNIC